MYYLPVAILCFGVTQLSFWCVQKACSNRNFGPSSWLFIPAVLGMIAVGWSALAGLWFTLEFIHWSYLTVKGIL